VIELLPHVNVTLNGLATVLLVLGKILIHQKQEKAHRNVMMATLVVSALFLACYLVYHFNVPSKKFPTDTDVAPLAARYFYYSILLSHVLLAVSVPFLAIASIYYGLKNNRAAHRKVVAWAWPIWLYVSVTGIIVYLMLYQIYVSKPV
jgi:putative membrane protein